MSSLKIPNDTITEKYSSKKVMLNYSNAHKDQDRYRDNYPFIQVTAIEEICKMVSLNAGGAFV